MIHFGIVLDIWGHIDTFSDAIMHRTWHKTIRFVIETKGNLLKLPGTYRNETQVKRLICRSLAESKI